ncbi:hypothetical protein FACS189413_15820 [Bacteroidia bacterium]|nr:hypothetical protein FACS189413_15820 [Bacteroidia bacterium]
MKRLIYSLIMAMCFLLPATGQNTLDRWEYWFDTNYDSRETRTVAPPTAVLNVSEALDFAAIPDGLHSLKFRVHDSQGNWSGIVSKQFFKPEDITFPDNEITGWEYWWDTNYDSRETRTVALTAILDVSEALDFAAIPDGLHSLKFRVHDSQGNWSGIVSKQFFKPEDITFPDNKITGWEYWWDTDFAGRTTKSVALTAVLDVSETFELATLPAGLHSLKLRVRDLQGVWSEIVSRHFYKPSFGNNSDNEITTYEYWFDADVANRTTTHTAPTAILDLNEILELATLPAGLHSLKFRASDAQGVWSSIVSKPFYKASNATVAENKIVAYEYWLDTNQENKISVSLTDPVAVFLLESIDLLNVPKDDYVLNLRVQDAKGLWSAFSNHNITVDYDNYVSVSAQGLDNLTVGEAIAEASLTYTLRGSRYADVIVNEDFAVSNLPAGITAGTSERTDNNSVRITLSGTPTTANAVAQAITVPSSITAVNAVNETEAIAVNGVIELTVQKGTQTAPAAPVSSSITEASITLTAITGAEYSMDEGVWQTSPAFTGLTPGTAYTFQARLAETADYLASPASEGATFTTHLPNGIGTVETPPFIVYPNPATDEITIAGISAGETVTITNLSGRELMIVTTKTENINIGVLPAGVYLVKAGNRVTKLIKK